MKYVTIFSVLVALLTLTYCSTPYYLITDFYQETRSHRTIAVLPFEMIFTGVKPPELSDNDLKEIGLAESQAFQISFINEILRSTNSGKRPISVTVQDYRKTLNILRENHISIESSWDWQSETLSKVLDVDAVVRARIEKNRLMSDLESYGVELAVRILNEMTRYQAWPWIPYDASTSKKIMSTYSLIDGNDGNVLWSISIDREADWRRSANEIIDGLNRKSADTFPYRIENYGRHSR